MNNKSVRLSNGQQDEVWSKFYLIPIVGSLVFFLGLCVTYVLAVMNGHVEPVLPFASYFGGTPPESSLFAQVTNLFSLTSMIAMYIRYLQVGVLVKATQNYRLRSLNSFCLWLETISLSSLSVVGNFQSATLYDIHFLAGTITILLHLFDMWIQMIFDYTLGPRYVTKRTADFRTLLTKVTTVVLVICGIATAISFSEFKGKSYFLWTPEDGGYKMHVLAVACEWFYITAACLWMATYGHQFKLLKLKPQIIFSCDEVDQNGKRE